MLMVIKDKAYIKWELPLVIALGIAILFGLVTSLALIYFWWADIHDKQLNDIYHE
jgi:hypothetical protein